jgi:ankyrin repeat protein
MKCGEMIKRRLCRYLMIAGLLAGPWIICRSPNWIQEASGLPVGAELLQHRAMDGDLPGIRQSLAEGVSVNAADSEGFSPLHFAVTSGDGRAVKLLIDARAEVNVASTSGTTPLSLAISEHHPELVEMLLEAGADASESPCGGQRPLYTACMNGELESVMALLRRGANVNALDARNSPAIVAAACAYEHTTEITRELLSAGADVNAADGAGCTALMEAARRGDVRNVLVLLESGADPTRINHDGHSARMLALDTGNWRVAEILSNAETQSRV